jgi:hypothetical protein
MLALDTVSFTVTAPGAAGLAMAPVTGDSANIRNSSMGSMARIVAMWTKSQAVGFTQITFPSGNDQTRNIRYRNVANAPINMFERGGYTPVQPQETMSLIQAGSAVALDVELAHLLVAYDDLPGVASRLIDVAALEQRFLRKVTVEDTITPTVASQYTGARALNAASDLLRANTDYAVLGVSIGITAGVITLRGVDTGNLRVGVPCQALANDLGINWFRSLSEWFGQPMIPTINSANKAGIFTEIVQDENLVAVPFAWHLAELSAS